MKPCVRFGVALPGWVSGARWMISLGAVVTLLGCGSDSPGQARTTLTDGQPSTTAMTVATDLEPDVSAVSTTDNSSPRPVSPKPTCHTFYRTSVTLSPDDGPVLAFTTPGTAEATFTDLHLTANYSDDGYEPPSLNVGVETLPDRALVFASLYQFADPTVNLNAFAATGQGFTGLIYVYNPASGSELQFFCTAA